MARKKHEWRLVGRVTRNDMRGKDPVSKLHKKLKAMAPDAEEIAQFGMSEEAVQYFRKQLEAIAEKHGYTKKAAHGAVAMAMLQYAPCEIEGLTGFNVYYREK